MAVIRKNFRFKILKQFFSDDELKLLQNYCLNAIKDPSKIKRNFTERDLKRALCPEFKDDPLMNTLLDYKKEIVEKASGLKLYKTYTFWRYYGFGSQLEDHNDRPACEVSLTACINKTDNWPLTINGTKVEINIGDAVLYLGVEDTHGRFGVYKGDGMAQVFMHYVDQNGPFTHHINDNYVSQTGNTHSEEDREYILNVLKQRVF
jgi:hypothetical protein